MLDSPTHKKSNDPHWPPSQRTEPGRGAELPDDGVPAGTLKTKSIPNAPTPRLERNLAHLHEQFHTVEALREHDGPRRDLIDNGKRIRHIAHELNLRGAEPGECRNCWGEAYQ